VGKTPVYLITGFLGSGKTTLIKRLLNSSVPNKKIAVVQNEFAPENFDGQDIIRSTEREFDLLEINNGSVFCVCLLAGFKESLINFLDKHNPDLVFFEASGLSDPISIGEIMNSPDIQKRAFLAASICIIDVSNFMKYKRLQQRIVHQVQVANQVILNKIDLIEDFQPVWKEIKILNPYSTICSARFCDVNLIDLVERKSENPKDTVASFQLSAEDMGRPDINSVVFKSTKPIRFDHYKGFLGWFSEKSIRIKGFLYLDNQKCMAVQFAGSNLESNLINREVKQTELIAMGFNINFQEVKSMYELYS
jgi:G3E family GTPase